MNEMPELIFADELAAACSHCAALSYIQSSRLISGNPLPEPEHPTATVTFLAFEGNTYAVTAAHVVNQFRSSVADPSEYTFFIPKAPGHALFDRFTQPPAPYLGQRPDIAIRKIDPGLPAHIGKKAYEFAASENTAPFTYALAVGYPTAQKAKVPAAAGSQIAMPCCHAVAHGISSHDGDQVQFYSEVKERPAIASLSGMSGGPVFWSDGERHGLIGVVKEALDNAAPGDEPQDAIGGGPRVHFLCQRITPVSFAQWVAAA